MQQELGRQRRCLVVPHGAAASTVTPAREVRATMPPQRPPSAVVAHQQCIARERRALQLERFQLVKRLQASGRTARAIIRETGIGWASVRKWIRLSDLPMRNRMAPRPGMPEFYREYL